MINLVRFLNDSMKTQLRFWSEQSSTVFQLPVSVCTARLVLVLCQLDVDACATDDKSGSFSK